VLLPAVLQIAHFNMVQKKVYAVDVGFGQLDWKLRQDKRVVVMEKTNIRYLEAKAIPEPVDFVCIDVSFISLAKVLPKIIEVLKPKSEIVALVKPQFEAGPDQVGKGGIVRSPKVHVEVLLQVVNFALELGLIMGGITFSPITGAKGNIEYLLYLVKNGAHQAKPLTMIADIVTDAWKEV
jgi:23S rRNA (cytidine1920-2'-O)/16S rRNA (cytidine1409-2'-O)-methyltransferase